MSNPLPLCPVCSGGLEITEGSCRNCDVQVRGHFTAGRYQVLTPEQATFLEAFLRCRGVIRDVEAALGISYPTVKSRLEATLLALGFQNHPLEAPKPPVVPVDPANTPPIRPEIPSKPVSALSHEQAAVREDALAAQAEKRRNILEAVQRGEISSEEGMRKLRG